MLEMLFTYTSEEQNSEDEKKETKAAGSGPSHGLENQTNRLAALHHKKRFNVRQREEKRQDIDDACDTCGCNREDNGLWNFVCRILHFLAHGCNHAVARKSVRGLEQADEECPT